MRSAAARYPEEPGHDDIIAEAGDLHRAALREMAAAARALRKLRPGALLIRATDEVALIGVRMAAIEKALKASTAALFCSGLDAEDVQDAAPETPETPEGVARVLRSIRQDPGA